MDNFLLQDIPKRIEMPSLGIEESILLVSLMLLGLFGTVFVTTNPMDIWIWTCSGWFMETAILLKIQHAKLFVHDPLGVISVSSAFISNAQKWLVFLLAVVAPAITGIAALSYWYKTNPFKARQGNLLAMYGLWIHFVIQLYVNHVFHLWISF